MTNDNQTDGQVRRRSAAVVNGPEGDDLDGLLLVGQHVVDVVGRLRPRFPTGSGASLLLTCWACLSRMR
jgi:hypothetical protein